MLTNKTIIEYQKLDDGAQVAVMVYENNNCDTVMLLEPIDIVKARPYLGNLYGESGLLGIDNYCLSAFYRRYYKKAESLAGTHKRRIFSGFPYARKDFPTLKGRDLK